MFALLRTIFGRVFTSKVGIALIAALVVGGGGTAMALATSHGQLPQAAATSTAHSGSDDGSHATKTSGDNDQDDQDDQECTRASASPTAHSDDGSDDGSHATRTPSATRTAGDDDQDERACATGTHTPAPEPTERPEGMHTPGPTPTGGHGGD